MKLAQTDHYDPPAIQRPAVRGASAPSTLQKPQVSLASCWVQRGRLVRKAWDETSHRGRNTFQPQEGYVLMFLIHLYINLHK